MKRFRVDAVLESPLVVRRERQSQRSDGVPYLAGTLLRGAFAQVYLQRHGQTDETFRRLFLDEESCRFGPLDPATRVIPLTAHSCKRYPGFGKDRHGVVDSLAVSLRARLNAQPWPHLRCTAEKCGHELKPHTGFWESENGNPTEPRRRWRSSMAAHVGIDRSTHTATESIFFTLPALEPEPMRGGEATAPTLHGGLDAQDDAIGALQELLAQEEHVLRIGHARTRGYGRVRVTIEEELPALGADWDNWSETMLTRAGPNLLDPGRYFFFSLSLPNGAVFLDELLRYTLDPAGMVPWLPRLPQPDPKARTVASPTMLFEGGRLWCVTAVARHERLRGWNAAHGLPRQDEWALSRGSVYAYLYEGDADGRALLLERLRELQTRGIGARRNEGFGRVMICDDFHPRFTPKEMT